MQDLSNLFSFKSQSREFLCHKGVGDMEFQGTKGKDCVFSDTDNILCNQTSGRQQLVATFIPSVKQTHKFSL